MSRQIPYPTADSPSDHWERYFFSLARQASLMSRDPSTKTGAVIVRPDRSIVSSGFNGFPRGTRDDPELYLDREQKYRRVVHAEMNAILLSRQDLAGCLLYTWPFLTCERCAVHVIQTGIRAVFAPTASTEQNSRWGESFEGARQLYREAGIVVIERLFEELDKPFVCPWVYE